MVDYRAYLSRLELGNVAVSAVGVILGFEFLVAPIDFKTGSVRPSVGWLPVIFFSY